MDTYIQEHKKFILSIFNNNNRSLNRRTSACNLEAQDRFSLSLAKCNRTKIRLESDKISNFSSNRDNILNRKTFFLYQIILSKITPMDFMGNNIHPSFNWHNLSCLISNSTANNNQTNNTILISMQGSKN